MPYAAKPQMKIFPTIRAARLSLWTAIAPTQYSATKFQASGPAMVPMWMSLGVVEWRKYAALMLKKLMTMSKSASQKYERTQRWIKPKSSRLDAM